MKAIKIINIFKAKENIPFMNCLITSMEENEKGINLTLENGENICIKDYGYYFLSEADGDLDREQMVNSYRRLISELGQMSEETITSLMP
ncbi:hypothetical protein GO309_14790 [Klebsiella variicola]|uniref:hypothetical protein n=1 Tax=Klebsiella variicola TaxID=244366 RepID=UPI001EE806E5|nr:hypothetical protein [Klebsiella variicola]MCG5490672.1 hypothetical protein [Klebsiella variicola]